MASVEGMPETGKGLIVCFGEMLIDFVPTVSGVSLAEATGFLKAPAAPPANVAIAVSWLGGQAAFIGKLGDDEFGHMLAGILRENGITGDGVTFDEGARTALAFVTLRDDGEREFMFYRNPSADMLLKPQELNLQLITSAKIFHYGSISLIDEPCRSAHLKAMKVAKEAGCLLSYDPNLRLPLWPSQRAAREQIMSIWEEADVIEVFLTAQIQVVLGVEITARQNPSGLATKDFNGEVEPFHVNTVDTTGAGDSFVGALLCKIVDDQSILEDEQRLRQVLKFANACGAITTTQKGAIPALPTEDEALSLLNGPPASSGLLSRILSFFKWILY